MLIAFHAGRVSLGALKNHTIVWFWNHLGLSNHTPHSSQYLHNITTFQYTVFAPQKVFCGKNQTKFCLNWIWIFQSALGRHRISNNMAWLHEWRCPVRSTCSWRGSRTSLAWLAKRWLVETTQWEEEWQPSTAAAKMGFA